MTPVLRDKLFATATFAIAVGCGYVAFGYAPDSSWFPRALCLFLGAMAILLFFRGKEADDVPTESLLAQVKAALLVLVGSVTYVGLVKLVNFEIATYLFLVLAMWLLGNRRPLVIIGVSLVTLILVKVMFFVLLDVSRPATLLL